MEIVFGACPDGPPPYTCYADDVKRAIAKAKSGGSSKKAVQDHSDDDFMPPKRGNVKPKFKSGGASKAVVDENSDDDFMPRKRGNFRPKCKSVGASKAVADENSDDDFTQRFRTRGRGK